jgi:hypothetical protein
MMYVPRKVLLIGICVVIFSMAMATQYATSKIGYAYGIVHPSNADIRFIGSDTSWDGGLVLRVDGDNSSGDRPVKLELGGNFSRNFNKTYAAAFGIVNEELFNVTITHINVSTELGEDYLQIWLHGKRDAIAGEDDTSVLVWNKGPVGFNDSSNAWVLGKGDKDPSSMNSHDVLISTPWHESSHVRYSVSDVDAINGVSDYVWVQISLNIPPDASSGSYAGLIWIHFRATTH